MFGNRQTSAEPISMHQPIRELAGDKQNHPTSHSLSTRVSIALGISAYCLEDASLGRTARHGSLRVGLNALLDGFLDRIDFASWQTGRVQNLLNVLALVGK